MSTQSDKGLGFDGAAVVARRDSSKKFAGNQSGLTGKVNAGRGPTKGNDGACGCSGMARSGKQPPVSASGTEQKRNPGGTRAFDPKAGQNYSGNADRINAGRGPTRGNQQ
jgi:hypothetical protein